MNKKIQVIFKHQESKEICISRGYTIDEIFETNLEEMQNETCHCDCKSVGESNVIECGLSCDYFDEFFMDGTRMSTGLEDKEGSEIYQGDIVKFKDGNIMEVDDIVLGDFVYIEHHECGRVEGKCEVIGNVYQNPELLITN